MLGEGPMSWIGHIADGAWAGGGRVRAAGGTPSQSPNGGSHSLSLVVFVVVITLVVVVGAAMLPRVSHFLACRLGVSGRVVGWSARPAPGGKCAVRSWASGSIGGV